LNIAKNAKNTRQKQRLTFQNKKETISKEKARERERETIIINQAKRKEE